MGSITTPGFVTAAEAAFIDAAISSRAAGATALSTAQWTNGRATNLDNLDALVSGRAPSATALSTAQWTNTRAGFLDMLGAGGVLTATSGTAQTSGVNSVFSAYTQLVASLSSQMVSAYFNVSISAGASAVAAKNQIAIAIGGSGSEVDQFFITTFLGAAPSFVTIPIHVNFKIAAATRVSFRSLTVDATHASSVTMDFAAFG